MISLTKLDDLIRFVLSKYDRYVGNGIMQSYIRPRKTYQNWILGNQTFLLSGKKMNFKSPYCMVQVQSLRVQLQEAKDTVSTQQNEIVSLTTKLESAQGKQMTDANLQQVCFNILSSNFFGIWNLIYSTVSYLAIDNNHFTRI